MTKTSTSMNIVIAGHVDHGKSTIIGRLLADTGSLPEGKLEQVKQNCELNSKPFEYAFLLDALKDERSQGITIDSARVFFKSLKREYIIIDAPGHIEFLKNMVTGAARAEAALLVIAADEGIQENSKRHCYLLSLLGIKQITVLVNKMDLVNYDEKIFRKIVKEYEDFLAEINLRVKSFIPVSGFEGVNLIKNQNEIAWYNGNALLEILDSFIKEPANTKLPFRMSVQDVYKFTNYGDQRRIIVGSIDSGFLKLGDEVVFYPSGRINKVKSLEVFNSETPYQFVSGEAIGFTLEEQMYITRGELVCKVDERKPQVAKNIRVNIFWLHKKPFEMKKDYTLKIGTNKVKARLTEIHRVLNSSDLSSKENEIEIKRNESAECTISLSNEIAFDLINDFEKTSRFVIVDNYEIAGGGIITKAVEDKLTWVRDNVIVRNYKWAKSIISNQERAEKYNQKSHLILLTGEQFVGKKQVAKSLEEDLFKNGKMVYFLGIGSVKYGIDADLNKKEGNKEEHLRRLAEVAHILLDSGMILIVTARALDQENLEIIKTVVSPDKIETIWVGEEISTDISFDMKIPGKTDLEGSVDVIKKSLIDKGIIFNPWD